MRASTNQQIKRPARQYMSRPLKIPSFTLTEMMVTLAISSIVAGLAFTIVTLFTYNIEIISENYSQKNKLQLLESQLLVEFSTYPEVRLKSSEDKIVFSSPIDSIFYKVSDSLLIRESDTLLKTPFTANYFYSGVRVKSGLIDAVKLVTDNPNIPYLFISKKQDAIASMITDGN